MTFTVNDLASFGIQTVPQSSSVPETATLPNTRVRSKSYLYLFVDHTDPQSRNKGQFPGGTNLQGALRRHWNDRNYCSNPNVSTREMISSENYPRFWQALSNFSPAFSLAEKV